MNPIKLYGPWNEGYALDKHTESSVYLGENEFGRPVYDTTRTKIGQLVYDLKYQNKQANALTLAENISNFIQDGENNFEEIDAILPAPPSKSRHTQPVFEIAKELSAILDIPYYTSVLSKSNPEEAKGRERAEVKIEQLKKSNRPRNVLLIDDVHRSGDTLRACTEKLKEDGNINKVYVLTMTDTRT